MQRRRLLLLTPLVPVGFLVSRYLRALAPKASQPVDYRAQALKLDELATGIHSLVVAQAGRFRRRHLLHSTAACTNR